MDTTKTGAEASTPVPVPTTVKTPNVTLVAGATLTRANGTQEKDKGTYEIAVGDRIQHAGTVATSLAIVDKGDGGLLDICPGADIACMAYLAAGDFDFRVDAGRGRINHAAATISARKKVLRSGGTTTAALGTVYSWQQTGVDITVACEQGSVELSNTVHGWTVKVDATKKVAFKDSDRSAPVPAPI